MCMLHVKGLFSGLSFVILYNIYVYLAECSWMFLDLFRQKQQSF